MISVIIPAYNSEKTIGRCLSALLEQSQKPDEIIVVDDGSSDNTKEAVKSFNGILLLEQEHKGPAAARNLGARNANGEILLFTDADCAPSANWVTEMCKTFEDKTVSGVQGRYSTEQKSIVAKFVQLEIEDRYDRMRKLKSIDFIGSYSAGYRKDVFLRHGGFDESFSMASGEDPDISFKLSKAGHKMVFAENAVVCHGHVDSLSAYLKQKFWRAYWRILLYKKHPGKMAGESYTPQTLKLQIFFTGLSLFTAFFSIFSADFIYLSVFSLALFALSALPLSYKNLRKDFVVGVSTPFILALRSVVFAAGLLYGVIKL